MRHLARLSYLALGMLLAGCGGPSYAGGPDEEKPHGYVVPGDDDVSVWRVDGTDTYTRSGTLLVAPGMHKLRVRLQHPIEAEDEGYEWKEIELQVEPGHVYWLERLGEGEFPPWDVKITERKH